MITIQSEFKMTTPYGITDCKAEKLIFRNYRDVDTVEDAIKYVNKLFKDAKLSNQCVTFIYDSDKTYGQSTTRFFRFYSDEINEVYFGDGFGSGISKRLDKFTKRDIRRAYLDCADRAIAYEETKAETNV